MEKRDEPAKPRGTRRKIAAPTFPRKGKRMGGDDQDDNGAPCELSFDCWADTFQACGPNAAIIEYECEVNADGCIVDADGNVLSDATHWRAQ